MRIKRLSPLLVLTVVMTSCGLKRAPTAPKNTNLPAIPDRYMYKLDIEKDEAEDKKAQENAPNSNQSEANK